MNALSAAKKNTQIDCIGILFERDFHRRIAFNQFNSNCTKFPNLSDGAKSNGTRRRFLENAHMLQQLY